MVILVLSYGCELWTVIKRRVTKIQASEITFLKGVKSYSELDHINNEDVREELHNLNNGLKSYKRRRKENIRFERKSGNINLWGIRPVLLDLWRRYLACTVMWWNKVKLFVKRYQTWNVHGHIQNQQNACVCSRRSTRRKFASKKL